MNESMSFFEAAGYEMLRLLGKGSDAKVWLVRDRQFGHVRALKVLNEPVGEDLTSSNSFYKECALLLRICNCGHPHIIRIGRPRVVMDRAMVEMQYVEGRTLTDYIHSDLHFVPYEEIVHFIEDIGSALACCHAEGYKWMMMPGDDKKMSLEELIAHYGVAHNDLHSSNVMRDMNGSYILLDFGLAIQDGVAVRSSMRNEGHPEYRAPEKFEAKMGGRQGDIRVDVYAFGILLFEMLTGDTPFHAEPGDLETGKIYRMHKEAPIPVIEPLRKESFLRTHPGAEYSRDYPGWLENMVRKCLAKNPDERYANMKEFMDEFQENVSFDKKLAGKQEELLRKENNELHLENEMLRSSLQELERRIKLLQEAGEVTSAREKTSARILQPNPAAVAEKSGSTPVWLGTLLGFLPAAAVGGLGASELPFSWGHSGEEMTDTESNDDLDVDIFLDTASIGPVPVASSVSGSFSEAFSAARREIGPGGVFSWHGNLYSTYTSDEWGRMTPEQQAAFGERVQEVELSLDDSNVEVKVFEDDTDFSEAGHQDSEGMIEEEGVVDPEEVVVITDGDDTYDNDICVDSEDVTAE